MHIGLAKYKNLHVCLRAKRLVTRTNKHKHKEIFLDFFFNTNQDLDYYNQCFH